ncbi:DUF1501 domain-containing protein [Planctomicrobium piriforme]|uniref:Tat (Twin-arginine translocation) pathway signal sequence n=1 Tax=Planctomicrobium piriforme TaxID=1576369 RepID=A0A1I3SSU2_9PLAN|nr:DUF1501 domain-containing protein [Planctomicrobium piriforme]SFJ61410.1 Protein of unknown function [Planctomicrobium piriforme]
MARQRTCDGIVRRDFLKAGVVGTTALNLASYLRWSSAGQVRSNAKAQSAIFINLQGGPSHMDTFDLKPQSSTDYRGEFQPIQTAVPGIEICEHLPNLAKNMDKFLILRGVTHTLAAHELGTEFINTGNRPIPSLQFPGYGAVVSKERPGPAELPPNVAIPNSKQSPGYLGVQYASLQTNNTPTPGLPYAVRGLSLSDGLTVKDVERRQHLLQDLDQTFRGFEQNSQLLQGLDRFSEQAYSMITSPRSREAFDVSRESESYREKFGKTPFGQSCLLATRLVESGVRFVTISQPGWDTHAENWTKLKENQLPPFDEGLAALLQGLSEKGLLDSTVVFVSGEFGRTPKINTERGGRDHYPRCMFMLLAGGGIQGGRVLGASNENATEPLEKGFKPEDVAASFYHALGIDHRHEYHTASGRPVMIIRDGQVLPELFA